MADCKTKRWWLVWGGIVHREDDPSCAITLQFKDGRHEPGMRAIRQIVPGEPFSVNFHHVPKELLGKCSSFADIAAARLAGVGLPATDEVMKSGVGALVNGNLSNGRRGEVKEAPPPVSSRYAGSNLDIVSTHLILTFAFAIYPIGPVKYRITRCFEDR